MDDKYLKKKVVDSTLVEYEEVLRRARCEGTFGKSLLEFLRASPKKCFRIMQIYPIFKLPAVCSTLPKLLAKKGFKVVDLKHSAYEGDVAVSRQMVEIDLDKTIEVVTMGEYYLTKGNKKFIIQLSFEDNPYTGYVCFFSLEKDKKIVLKLLNDLTLWLKQHNFLKGKQITPFGKFLKLKKYSWDDIILSEKIENEIRRNVEKYLKNFDIYRANDLPTKRGILLTGDPGVGKTLLAKVLVSTLTDVTFIWVTPKYFTSSCGNSTMEMLFDLVAETSPTILFMEDIDFYGVSRERGNNMSALGEFLNKVDGLVENEEVLIIMTTNHPELLDKAIKERPGRFDRVIKILPPEKNERFRMLTRFCKGLKTVKIDEEKIVDKTRGFTGALLKELIITAANFAIEDKSLGKNKKVILEQKHFDMALDTLKEYCKTDDVKVAGFNKTDNENGKDVVDECCTEDAMEPVATGNSKKDTPYKRDDGERD